MYLRHKPVEVGVGWPLHVKGAVADLIDGFIVKQDSHISVLKERVVDRTCNTRFRTKPDIHHM